MESELKVVITILVIGVLLAVGSIYIEALKNAFSRRNKGPEEQE